MQTATQVTPEQVKKPKSRKKSTIIISVTGIVLLIIAATAFYNWDYLQLYYWNARYNKLNPGNKLYERPDWVKDTLDVDLFRLIRPITDKDIDDQQLTELEKDIAKKVLISSTKTYLHRTSWHISADKLIKLKSAYIGTYQGSDIMDDFISGKTFTGLYFIINPNEKVLGKDKYEFHKLPKGYTWANGPFYVNIYDISEKESPEFKK
ncbi:hypothetical protein EWM62_03755 [Mucilaginibacter terrigena]|uniref:Uncharacterized protein n=3 Tax=Mucilaginibacter terrigena TaxID=2492395 RepID=A0A4Q5LNW7_9SPHI|nr:hypothetical protein EWM62_19070 [Mucilaginibacter terrigena]RYU91062.1 hypothetical protein EWM62_03755 [Mucilaginibacter terrigena]